MELGQRGYVGMPDIDSSTHDYHKSTECCGEETERWVNLICSFEVKFPEVYVNNFVNKSSTFRILGPCCTHHLE